MSATDGCPSRNGPATAEFVVGFHAYPAEIQVGDDFACGRTFQVDEEPGHPIAFILVEVWDEDDFLRRTGNDPNVRYAEPRTYLELEDTQPTPYP